MLVNFIMIAQLEGEWSLLGLSVLRGQLYCLIPLS